MVKWGNIRGAWRLLVRTWRPDACCMSKLWGMTWCMMCLHHVKSFITLPAKRTFYPQK
jgi:hypothetical protein